MRSLAESVGSLPFLMTRRVLQIVRLDVKRVPPPGDVRAQPGIHSKAADGHSPREPGPGCSLSWRSSSRSSTPSTPSTREATRRSSSRADDDSCTPSRSTPAAAPPTASSVRRSRRCSSRRSRPWPAASPVVAKLLWHALNLVCLGLGIWLSMKAWDAARGQIGLPARSWLPMLFAPLVAILLPLQTNFEHQNMNALLLALLAGATWQLTLGSAAVAGLLIGTGDGAQGVSSARDPLSRGAALLDRGHCSDGVGVRAVGRDADSDLRRRGLLRSRADVLAAGQQRLADSGQQPVAHRRARSADAGPLVSRRRSRGRQGWSRSTAGR